MLIQKLTLICASVTIAVLTACGGANMSGAIGPRKEKTDKSGAKDASAPAVVTGAYLYCDYSPTDNQGDGKAVGCSVMTAENVRMEASSVEGIDYEAESGGKTYPPSKTNTPIWGAVWTGLTNLSSTTFHASVSTFDKQVVPLSCTAVPCKSAPFNITSKTPPGKSPKAKISVLTGIWRGNGNNWYLTSEGNPANLTLKTTRNPAEPDDLCDSSGQVVSKNTAQNRMKSFALSNAVNPLTGLATSIISTWLSNDFDNSRSLTSIDAPACVRPIGGELVRSGRNCAVAILRLSGTNVLSAAVFPVSSSASIEKQLEPFRSDACR
jgi:hypothetical protein